MTILAVTFNILTLYYVKKAIIEEIYNKIQNIIIY